MVTRALARWAMTVTLALSLLTLWPGCSPTESPSPHRVRLLEHLDVASFGGNAQRWLQGDQFDSVMNYIFTWNTISFCGGQTLHPTYENPHLKLKPLDAAAFGKNIDTMHGLYDWEINHVQLNLIDSHDMPRALWIMQDDKSALRLCVLLQMTMPGAPPSLA